MLVSLTERAAVPSTKWLPHPAQAKPARSQDAEEVAVAEDQDVARKRTEPPDHPVGAGTDVHDRLAARATVAEEMPAGPVAADFIGGRPS